MKLTQPKKIDVPAVVQKTEPPTIEVMEEELDDALLQIDEELPEALDSEGEATPGKKRQESAAVTSEPSETVPSAPGSPNFLTLHPR